MSLLETAKSADELKKLYERMADPWICEKAGPINASTYYSVKAVSIMCWLDNTVLGTVVVDEVVGPGQSSVRDITSNNWTVNKWQASLLWTHPALHNEWRPTQTQVFQAQPGSSYKSVGPIIKEPGSAIATAEPLIEPYGLAVSKKA